MFKCKILKKNEMDSTIFVFFIKLELKIEIERGWNCVIDNARELERYIENDKKKSYIF